MEQLLPLSLQEYFSIHRYTGDLSVRFSLDLGYRYIVTVTATVSVCACVCVCEREREHLKLAFIICFLQDEGEPALSTSLNVSIRVDPVPPIFDKAVYETDLFEFTNEVYMIAMINNLL